MLDSKFIDSVLRRMLLSKRMLFDHVEILERCQIIPSSVDHSKNKAYGTILFGGIILSSMAVVSFKMSMSRFRYLLRTVASTSACWFAREIFVVVKQKLAHHRLNETILVIDQIDLAFRRNITFFRESQILESNIFNVKRLHERNQIFLKSIIEIIHILYQEVKLLESISLPDIFEIMYDPLEDLSTCVYFEKDIDILTFENLKIFHNIFLFFQSQYFLRFYLLMYNDKRNGFKYLNNEMVCFRKNIKIHTEKLIPWLYTNLTQKPNAGTLENFRIEISNTNNPDLLHMKRFSTDVMCRLIAISNKYESIDERITSTGNTRLDKVDTFKISNEISILKDSLNAVIEDLEALKLINNKFYAQTLQLPMEVNENLSESDTLDWSKIPNVKETKNFEVEEESQEYFLFAQSESREDKYNMYSLQEENREVTRSSFAPVLKQLKTIIKPIKTEMKERELKYLISKGLNCDKMIEFNKNEETSQVLVEPDILEEDALATSRSKSSKDLYSETRSFLQHKQPIMFIPMNNLPLLTSQEDILE